MSNKKTICFISFLLMANLASAGPKGSPPLNRGFFSNIVVGFRVLTHRLRARTTPQEDARTMLETMQTLLENMRSMVLLDAEPGLVQMQNLQTQYLDFIREYGVHEADLAPREATEFLRQAQALVQRLRLVSASTPERVIVSENVEMTPADVRAYAVSVAEELEQADLQSPSAGRISFGLRQHIDRPDDLRRFLNQVLEEQFAENLGPLRGQLQALLQSIGGGRMPVQLINDEPIDFNEVPDFGIDMEQSAESFNEIPNFDVAFVDFEEVPNFDVEPQSSSKKSKKRSRK